MLLHVSIVSVGAEWGVRDYAYLWLAQINILITSIRVKIHTNSGEETTCFSNSG